MPRTYTYQEAYDKCLKYFGGDELAANVVVTKYLLTDNKGDFLERTPDDMHQRRLGTFHSCGFIRARFRHIWQAPPW